MKKTIALTLLLSLAIPLHAQRYLGARPTDSGGPLLPEQAAYDVTFYDLALNINPEQRSIDGSLRVEAKIVHPLEWFVLDLDTALTATKVELLTRESQATLLKFERRGARIWTHLRRSRQPGERASVRVHYNGKPKVAPMPPWVGGFTWAKTADGQHWIATSVQNDGADLWWPCKDHPSDEADSVAITITVPKPLVVASNGKLRHVSENANQTRTYFWFHSNPINNYNVALNIAPYRTLETAYKSTAGETVPVIFYALPESFDKAQAVFPQLNEHLAFYEKLLGPYPFRADKYGVAETPHLGMEHQTIIAYGRYRNNAYGYDDLHHHELGHEWWGNLVTAMDWRDFWIHEGFCAYMQHLYTEQLRGEATYHESFKNTRGAVRNLKTLAPRESRTATQVYFAAPEYVASDGDIYTKGSLVLHALRYLIGKEALLKTLRLMAYPTPEMEKLKDGRLCRFVTTDDFVAIAEEVSGMKLDWFFEVYVRRPVLPLLNIERTANALSLRWDTPDNLPFPMPVEVKLDGKVQRVEMTNGAATLALENGEEPVVDPKNWIFKRE